MQNKLILYKTDEIEIVINERTGESFASIRATARMCLVSETAIRQFIKGANYSLLKNCKIYTGSGIQGANLLNEDQILQCICKYNPPLLIKFAQLGLRKFFHNEVGYTYKPSKQLYPDRSAEYKELYQELKDLIKLTKGGKHHYIQLNRTLNEVVGKVEGRTNNTIDEVENLAYVLAMKKAISTGNSFIKATSGHLTRLAIKKQLEKLKPQLQAIQDNLKLLE
jgi:hypothetical protein